MRIIDVPYAYRADIVAPRHRTARRLWIVDTVPVRIRELSGEEAPVAAVWKGTRKENDYTGGTSKSVTASLSVTYRAVDGLLVRPYSAEMRSPEAAIKPWAPVLVDDLQADLDTWAARVCARGRHILDDYKRVPWSLSDDPRLVKELPLGCTRIGDVQARAWDWTEGPTKRALITRLMGERSAFIDGVFHIGSSGPAWRVYAGGISAEPEYANTKNREMILRGDRRDVALQHCLHLRGPNAPRAAAAPTVTGRIDIIDPKPFRHVDDIGPALSEVCSRLVVDAREKIGHMAPSSIIRFAALKTAALASAIPDREATLETAVQFEREWIAHLAEISHPAPEYPVASLFVRRMAVTPADTPDAEEPGAPAMR